MPFLSEPTRAWIYRIFTAIIVILITYNVIDPNEAVAWTGLGMALIGNAMATINTSTRTGETSPEG